MSLEVLFFLFHYHGRSHLQLVIFATMAFLVCYTLYLTSTIKPLRAPFTDVVTTFDIISRSDDLSEIALCTTCMVTLWWIFTIY